MKKLICLVLAALLCVGAVAMAESSVPSKSTADLTQATGVQSESGVEVKSDFVLEPATASKATAEQTAATQKVIDELTATSAKDYCSDVTDKDGNGVDVTAILGADKKPVINEVMPLTVENYDSSYGDMKASYTFATEYDKDEPVVIVLTIVDPVTGKVKKIAVEGKGNGVNGGIDVVFPAEVMEAMNGACVTMSVVSAAK